MDVLRKIRAGVTLFRGDRATLAQLMGVPVPGQQRAERYLEGTGATSYFKKGYADEFGLSRTKAYDVANLHKIVCRLRPKTILEFGCGFSTLAMAHALKMNRDSTGKGGKLFVVEAVEKWADNVRGKLGDLEEFVEIRTSEPRICQLNGHVCHTYVNLPNVRPDFIYLDGPDPKDVTGDINGISIAGLKFVCAADPLLYEWGFYPGFQMLVDGRFANVEFLKKNLKRKYRIRSSAVHSNALFTLIR